MGTSEPSIEVVATGLAAGGDALARADDGRVVFVAGALPGERVVARVVDTRRDFLRAETIEVLDASADRVAPRHSACGGCTWQHVAATAQPGLKVGIVVDALRRIAGLVDVPVVARPGTGGRSLRTTVRLGVGADGRAGERRRGTHEVVPASPGCAALHPALAELVRESRFPASASEVVLRVGVASGERAAHVDAAGPAERSSLPSDVQVGPEAVVHEEVAGAWLQVSIRSFFQPGPVAAGELVAAVDEAVGDALPAGGHLLDAYAGVGLFGATVGSRRSAGRVTAVEISRPAVADARVNLARAGVDGRVVRSEVARWRPTATPDPAIDVVVADPARTGLGRPGVAAVAAAGVDRLVLVSCDPASLARDTALLAGSGFALRRVELVDAFPDTFHVEAVARFDRC